MSRHSPTQLIVHLVWATRRRRPVIAREHDAQLHALIKEAARSIGCEVIAVGNASDHVHAVVALAPVVSVAALMKRVKGRSSYFGPWDWQRGYFAESMGHADLGPLTRYVARQREHHDGSHPAELWLQSKGESAAGGLED